MTVQHDKLRSLYLKQAQEHAKNASDVNPMIDRHVDEQIECLRQGSVESLKNYFRNSEEFRDGITWVSIGPDDVVGFDGDLYLGKLVDAIFGEVKNHD